MAEADHPKAAHSQAYSLAAWRGAPLRTYRNLAGSVVLDDELHFTGHWNLGALGASNEARVKLVNFHLEVRGELRKNINVSSCCCHLEDFEPLALLLHVDELARLNTERWAVNKLAVNEDVAVHHELASLSGGSGESRTNQERVKARLKDLNQVLTGQAGSATGFLERYLQLSLADAILGAQSLLLAQTDGVVAVLLALGAAVFARRVWALLKILCRLRRQRNAECARETGLAACA